MRKLQSLRNKYRRFIYKNYFWRISKDNLEIFFDFKIEPEISFKPRIKIENIDKSRLKKIGDRVLNNLIFSLGLIEMLSYWKATCSTIIEIQAGYLNKEQIKFWEDLIFNGLGQFFYENKIDFTRPNFLKISGGQGKPKNKIRFNKRFKNRYLVPIGGGKDSAITSEILKKARKNVRCFSLNPTEAAQKIMKIACPSKPWRRRASCEKPIIVRRKIDEKLLELNRQGFLNGHTPFSAYLAFLSVMLAAIFDYKYIALSNERSSNEGNVKYFGKTINHQYSKSFEFEKKFRSYAKKYLAKDIEYFSFLRPLYEIQIAKLFSKYPKYFSAFLSCNEAFKTYSGRKKPTKKWCSNCPKCLFVFATLYPFVEERKLIKIFGQNLFEKKNLLPTMLELIGERKFKPFECVGTKKESLIAFYLSWKKSGGQSSAKLPFLLEYFENKILPRYKDLKKMSKKLMNSWNSQHNLPYTFGRLLNGAIM